MDSKVNECHRCSVEHDDPVLDVDNIYVLNELVQGRLREEKKDYALFLDVQKDGVA